MKLGMKHGRVKSIIVYLHGDLEFTRTYFTARSNFVSYDFIQKNVKMIDPLVIIAACVFEVE